MIAVVCAAVKQFMELRRGRERNDNQQVSREQAGECVLPRFGVSKPLHFHPFKALYRPWQKIVMRTTLRSSMRGVEEGVATATTWSDYFREDGRRPSRIQLSDRAGGLRH
jgi:hypothetical protein